MKRAIGILTALTMLLVLASCGGENAGGAVSSGDPGGTDEPLVIKVGTQDYPGSPDEKIYNYFCDLVSERSEGKIEIAIYNQSQLGSESELLQQVMERDPARRRRGHRRLHQIHGSAELHPAAFPGGQL